VQVLNSKLDAGVTSIHIKSLILYEGSITNFDSRLHGIDIGTCLEVFLNPFYISIIDDFNFHMMCPKSIYFIPCIKPSIMCDLFGAEFIMFTI
jgi:hypothetical protein